jgi:hypothetical protein
VTLHRVNSAGTIQTSSSLSAEQTATAGVKTFTFSSQSLGTWASGDRLRVDYRYRNAAHGGQSFDAAHGGTDNEVVAPWDTAAEPHALTGSISGTGTLAGTAGIRRVLDGSVSGVGSLSGALEIVGGTVQELTGSVAGTGTVAGDLEIRRVLSGTLDGTGTLAGTLTIVDTGFDPADLDVTINGTTAELTWSASPTAGVADYQVFRRTPQTGDPFDPETDTPVATGITDLFYDDVGLDPGDWEWQVFGRIPA